MMGDQATETVIQVLNELEIPYMLTGSMALNLYGMSRSTEDADFIVQLGDGKGIREVAAGLGTEFILDKQASFETVTGSHRHIFQLRDTKFKVELFLLKDHPFDHSRFSRRRKLSMGQYFVFGPTIEDIIVQKLRWGATGRRTKDIADLEMLMKFAIAPIDWTYVEPWADEFQARQLLDQLRTMHRPDDL